jgi:hypothetical protein
MKLNFTLLAAIGVPLSILLVNPAVAAETKPADRKEKTKENEDPRKSAKANSSRNNNAVKIYPDLLKRVMHVVAKDNDGKEIDFFVFDLQGTLMQHYKMSEGDREKIALARGKYVYHVFSGDEETATGEFEIR